MINKKRKVGRKISANGDLSSKSHHTCSKSKRGRQGPFVLTATWDRDFIIGSRGSQDHRVEDSDSESDLETILNSSVAFQKFSFDRKSIFERKRMRKSMKDNTKKNPKEDNLLQIPGSNNASVSNENEEFKRQSSAASSANNHDYFRSGSVPSSALMDHHFNRQSSVNSNVWHNDLPFGGYNR